MAKLAMISVMLIVAGIGGAEVYAAPVISFVEPPTPADGATIGVDWAEIEVFIQDEGLRDVIFNWDSTDHYLYDDSLVLMFNFDNVAALGENYAVAGDVVKDLSSAGNDGYLSNEALDPDMVPAWISNGRYGGAFDFTGEKVDGTWVQGQSIRVPHSESLNPYGGDGDFSIAFWILTRDDYDGDVIRKGSTDTGDGRWYKVEHAGGGDIDALSLNFNTDGTDATVTSTEVYNDNQWHFVVAQRRSGQAELWIDGALDGTAPITGSIYNDADLAIGSKDTQNDDFLNSALDEIRIYNRSFNQVEITELYYSNLSKYDSEEWLLYVNQSNLAEGTYTYQAFAADSLTMSQTEQRSVTYTQAQKPIVSLEQPADGSIVNTTDVVFSCSATDGIGLLDASLYVGEEPQIVSFSGPSDTEDAQLYASDDSSTPPVEGPDTNAGDAASINVDGANPHAHGVIKFLNVFGSGPGQVPPGSTITYATLEINCSNPGNVMKLYRLAEDWVEGEVTWNDRTSGTPWLDAGADGTGSNAGISIDGNCSITGVKTIDITQFVQEWSDGAVNFGFVITDTGTDGVDFDSSESGNPPVLTVSFGQSGLQLIETVPMSGTSDSVSFSAVTLSDQQNHVWNCLVRSSLLLENWAAADFTLTVDTQCPDEPVLVAPADGATGVPVPATLVVTVSDPQSNDVDVTFYGHKKVLGPEDFTIVVLPDTQKYAESYPDIFTSQTQWIVDNKEALNIVFVTHEGDIVNNWNSTTEWDRANTSMSLLDGVVPYSVVPGDHDHSGEDPAGSTEYYEQYFPASRFADDLIYPYWGGSYAGNYGGSYDETYPHTNNNNYQLMTIGGDDYIFVSLDFCPSQDEIDWANGILTTYSERKAILTTHGLLDTSANYFGSGDFWLYPDGSSNPTGDTSLIWYDLIRNHENLQLVLCGHMHGEARRTDDNLFGKPVHQLLANYQGRTNGGNGWLRIMRFVAAENKVYVETYSPYLEAYETDGDSQFTLDFPMDWFTEIGTNTGVASGTSTSVVWPGLSALTEYEWFVEVTDPTTRTSVGPVWSFTTEPPEAEAPVITGAIGNTSGTTGESVTISATITDNVDVTSATVYYTPIGASETTEPMIEGENDLWSTNIPVAPDKLGTITYHIVADDPSANTATDPTSGAYDIAVTDNDAPSAVGDLAATAVAGGAIDLAWSAATDNIGVVSYNIYRESTEITDLTELTALATGIAAGPPYTDSTAADGTTYYYAVAALDGAANKAAVSNSPSATSDGSGPAISGVASSSVTGSEATISWTTDEAGDSVVVYGTATPPGSQQSDAAMVTAHSVALTGLSAATTYYFEVKSTDAIGNTSTDNNGGAYYTFTTETLPNTLFTDGFESGSFAAGGWQTTGDASVREPAAYTGLYGVQLKKAASIVKTVSTVGYSAIHVKYARKTKGFDTGEWLFVEWSTNGSTWNLLEQTQDVSWASRDIACGTGADDQSTFMLRFSTNANNSSETGFVDDVEIIGTPSGPDNDAPSPNPMTWAAVPQATGSVSISMTATTATDVSGVEYYFACTAGGGHDSGWQDSASYEDTGLLPDTQYTYQAKARDKSANQNETAFSSAASATTLPDDTTPPSPDPMSWATLPYATGATSIAMAAATATDVSGVEYYFATAGGGHDSDWQDSTSYEDTGLSPDTTYTYTVTARDKSANQNATDASSAESATTQPSGVDEVHVENIDMNLEQAGKNWKGVTTVLIHNQNGMAQSRAAVVGNWFLNGEIIQTGAAGTTDGSGEAVITSPPKKAKSGDTYTFTVTDVAASGYTYNDSLNVETSDSIIVP